MVKKADRVNKSDVIRELHARFPEMGPTKMVEYLAAKGLKVTPELVSVVVSKIKRGVPLPGKWGRPVGSRSERSLVILKLREDYPNAGPKRIAELLSLKGIEGTPAMVSSVFSYADKRAGVVRRPGRPTGKGNNKARRLAIPEGTYDPEAVATLVDKMAALRAAVKLVGGVDAAFTLLKSLQKLELV